MNKIHYCPIGECNPRKMMLRANDACRECCIKIYSRSIIQGTVYGLPTGYYQSYNGFACTLHGTSAMICRDIEDKHETWQCHLCKVEKRFRIRQYTINGNEL